MSQCMAGYSPAFPAAIDFAFRCQACIEAETVQQTVGTQVQQPLPVLVHCMFEGASRQQSEVGEGHRFGFHRDFIGHHYLSGLRLAG